MIYDLGFTICGCAAWPLRHWGADFSPLRRSARQSVEIILTSANYGTSKRPEIRAPSHALGNPKS